MYLPRILDQHPTIKMNMEWYYLNDLDQEVGPHSEAELRDLIGSGALKKETMVWNEGMENWLSAAESSLSSLFESPSAQRVAPPLIVKTPENHPPRPPNLSPAVGFGRDDSLVYPTNPPRSPNLAWLTLLGPGLAQIVFGKTSMGIVSIVVFNFVIVPLSFFIPMIPILIYMTLLIIDGYKTGNRLKEGIPVGKWQLFPGKNQESTSKT